MDVVTHGMVGLVVASPLASTHPEASAAFMLGSVLPDLDAASRIFGKRAFMHAHQTYTHSTPIILAVGAASWIALAAAGIQAPLAAPALVLGMLLHSYMDLTNTYGITVFAPLTHRRWSVDWVFFIDAVVVSASVPAAAFVGWTWYGGGDVGWTVPGAYMAVLAAYWAVKAFLRRRADGLEPPGTVSLVPSALVPWEFLGAADEGSTVRLFRLDARSGRVTDESRQPILDRAWHDALAAVPEYRLMRRLSPAYHVVEALEGREGTEVLCKDLRTRNFGGRFGELRVVVREGAVVRTRFNV